MHSGAAIIAEAANKDSAENRIRDLIEELLNLNISEDLR